MRRLQKLLRRNWQRLVIGTWNIGNGTVADALALMRQCHVLCFQEASDQDKIRKALLDAGYKLIAPDDKPGQAAVFIAYDPKVMELRREFSELVLDKQYIGPGAGPDHNKPKWLIGGVFRHKPSGRRVCIGVTHVVPSQYNSYRLKAAIDQNERVEATMDDFECAVFVAADWNAEPDAKSLSVWRKARWNSVLRALKMLDTHGRRSIDDILFGKRSWVRLVTSKAESNRSDHNAVIATFMLKPR